jgi:hypothetical protein
MGTAMPRNIPRKSMYLMILLGLLFTGSAIAEYTDTVVLQNGDQITGKVKGLAQGQLSLSTDAMGTVLVEWGKITEIRSEIPMQVETTSSTRYFGQLGKPAESGNVAVSTATEIKAIPLEDVVHITPIRASVWKRIQGSLDAGFSYTKSSEVAQYSVGFNALYRARQNQVAVKYNSIFTRQDSGTTQQIDSGLNYKRFRQKGWFGTGFLALQRNQTLGIDGRGLVGAGLGRNLLQSSHGMFSLSGGLDLNIEDTTDGSEDSVEAFGTLEYLLYKYKGNQTNLVLEATVFPSLTESGRVRSQFSTRFNYELFNHFFWGLTFYGTSDNEPPEGATAKNDYGVITSLGWSFGP